MTEWKDGIGIVHYKNESLGIPENKYGYSSLCHFFPDETRIPVEMNAPGMWDDGRKGLLIGWIDEIVGSPRYECVFWEDGSIGWIHSSRLK